MPNEAKQPLGQEIRDYSERRLKESGGPFQAPERTRERVKSEVETRFALQRIKGAVFRQLRTSKPLRVVGWSGAAAAVLVVAALAWNRGDPSLTVNDNEVSPGDEWAVSSTPDGMGSTGPEGSRTAAVKVDVDDEPEPPPIRVSRAGASRRSDKPFSVSLSGEASADRGPASSEGTPDVQAEHDESPTAEPPRTAPRHTSTLVLELGSRDESDLSRSAPARSVPVPATAQDADSRNLESSSPKASALVAVSLNVHLSLGLFEPMRIMRIGTEAGVPVPAAAPPARPAERPISTPRPESLDPAPPSKASRRPARFEQWFVRDPEPLRRRNLNSPPLPRVLEHFCLLDDGQRWSIRDEDGSAYEIVLTSPARAENGAAPSTLSGATASQALSSVCEEGGFEFKAVGESADSGDWVVFDGRVGCTPCENVARKENETSVTTSTISALAATHRFTVDGLVWFGEHTRFRVQASSRSSESVLFTAR